MMKCLRVKDVENMGNSGSILGLTNYTHPPLFVFVTNKKLCIVFCNRYNKLHTHALMDAVF